MHGSGQYNKPICCAPRTMHGTQSARALSAFRCSLSRGPQRIVPAHLDTNINIAFRHMSESFLQALTTGSTASVSPELPVIKVHATDAAALSSFKALVAQAGNLSCHLQYEAVDTDHGELFGKDNSRCTADAGQLQAESSSTSAAEAAGAAVAAGLAGLNIAKSVATLDKSGTAHDDTSGDSNTLSATQYFTALNSNTSGCNSNSSSASNRTGHTRMGQILLWAQDLPSTQEWMRQHGSRLGPGLVLLADKQSSGKGRGANTWTSPAGCLMFTAARRLAIPGSQAPFINYVVSLGVLHGLQQAVTAVAPGADLGIRIKWPNDLHAPGSLKVSGALIHTTFQGGTFNVLVGVGLNLDNAEPTTCISALLATALAAAQQTPKSTACDGGHPDSAGAHTTQSTVSPDMRGQQQPGSVNGSAVNGGRYGCGVRLQREAVLGHVVAKLDEYFQVFEKQGFAPLQAAYLASWLHSGQKVAYQEQAVNSVGSASAVAQQSPGAGTNSAASSSSGVQGSIPEDRTVLTICGLSESGFLLAEDGEGRAYELTPDGNSLDMMQGLLRRKL